jgi:hypothetical protein
VKLLALAGIGLVLAGGVAAASSEADPVTLSMRQYLDSTKRLVYVWYGQVASGAANEDVEVLVRDCLAKDFRLFAAAKTVAGGGYEVDTRFPDPFAPRDVNSGMAFRARWRAELSAPVLWRLPLYGVPRKSGRTKWKVTVNPAPIYLAMAGRVIVLQRQLAGKWVRYKQARLVRKANFDYGGATNHEAVFEVPRGLRVRLVVPAKTAAPCFLGSTSSPWRS